MNETSYENIRIPADPFNFFHLIMLMNSLIMCVSNISKKKL